MSALPPSSPDTNEARAARRNGRRFHLLARLGAYAFRLEILGLVILILAGGLLWRLANDSFVQSLAANLVAAGLVGLLLLTTYGWVVRRGDSEESATVRQMLEEIWDHFFGDGNDSAQRDGRVFELVREGFTQVSPVFQSAHRVGLTEVFEYRPTKQINQEVIQARKVVHIMEISLHSMRDVKASDWIGCSADDLRIIVLDPRFPETEPLAAQRDLEESRERGTIIKEIHDLLHRLPGNWFPPDGDPRVKLARTMPTLSYFRIDDVAYFSPLVHNEVGDATLHLRLRRDGEFFQVLERHFEALWSDALLCVNAVPAEMPRTYG